MSRLIGFTPPRTSSGKQLSDLRRSNLAIIARPNEIVPATARTVRQRLAFFRSVGGQSASQAK